MTWPGPANEVSLVDVFLRSLSQETPLPLTPRTMYDLYLQTSEGCSVIGLLANSHN